MSDELQLLTPDQVAELLGVTPKLLAQWRWKGVGPQFTKLGGNHRCNPVRYPRSAVREWLGAQPVGGGTR